MFNWFKEDPQQAKYIIVWQGGYCNHYELLEPIATIAELMERDPDRFTLLVVLLDGGPGGVTRSLTDTLTGEIFHEEGGWMEPYEWEHLQDVLSKARGAARRKALIAERERVIGVYVKEKEHDQE